MSLTPRAVVIHRRTEFEELVAGHGTRQQAAFFLRTRGRTLEEVEARHAAQQDAATLVAGAIPLEWRRGRVERAELGRFIFGAEDVVVVVGQDGLVANVAKYLDSQPVIGVNPEPGRNAGVLVTHSPAGVGDVLGTLATAHVESRTMVRAVTDDGQTMLALNEIYLGHASHQSARYRIQPPGEGGERQSSSGLLVGTGTGSTGWCRSVWLERHSSLGLPRPEQASLCWFVREAWPSPASGTALTEGTLGPEEGLLVVAESDLVLFGDGMESDAISIGWGQGVTFSIASRPLRLVV